jgi:hypothetical protein
MTESAARLRGQIYEAKYSLRFIAQDLDCQDSEHTVNQCRPTQFRRYCNRAKQLRRIETLKGELASLRKFQRARRRKI